jgi:hypothetical protein
MNYRLFLILLGIACIYTHANGQPMQRMLGARAYQLDDGTRSGKTMTWDISGTISQSYQLHWPATAPTANTNYCVADASGNMWWQEYPELPPLTAGNMWVGNSLNAAQQFPPGPVGSILTINSSAMPEWSSSLPAEVMMSANQITSGTLQPGVNITVGNGATIVPSGGGNITANGLSGAGIGKYSGKIDLATGINYLDITYPGITAASSVTVSVFDPQATIFGFVGAQVSEITPGMGFRVIFSADYPNSLTGQLHYTVVNP